VKSVISSHNVENTEKIKTILASRYKFLEAMCK